MNTEVSILAVEDEPVNLEMIDVATWRGLQNVPDLF